MAMAPTNSAAGAATTAADLNSKKTWMQRNLLVSKSQTPHCDSLPIAVGQITGSPHSSPAQLWDRICKT